MNDCKKWLETGCEVEVRNSDGSRYMVGRVVEYLDGPVVAVQTDNLFKWYGPASAVHEIPAEKQIPDCDNYPTECEDCGREAVYFNPFNVTVQCHSCGHQATRSVDERQRHFMDYLRNLPDEFLRKLEAGRR